MTIAVTGGAGFIGGHLCRRLLSDGHRVTAIDNFAPFYPRAIKEEGTEDFPRERFTLIETDICNTGTVRQALFTQSIDAIRGASLHRSAVRLRARQRGGHAIDA